MDLAAFRAAFPEFENASDALVSGKLTEAARLVDSEVFGDAFDQAHGYRTAHMLALSPFGRGMARLEADKDSTTYYRHFQDLVTIYNAGWARVV